MTKDELIKLLKAREQLFVKFTKNDGSERIIRGTLHPNAIPHISGTSIKGPEHLVTVYDLDKQDWRNINLKTNFEVLNDGIEV
ncbi:hypothetical protein EBZ38_01570 [bacterium]|nr:hypothetical protein [bacterium]